MKPRILQLIDSFNEGGSERQALQLTRLLIESGRYEVHLASLDAAGVLRVEAERMGFTDIPCYPLTSFYDRNTVSQLRRFVKHLRDSRIAILHTHDFYTNIFGMSAGFLAQVPIRIASRRETSGMRTAAQLRLQKVAYGLAHRVIANSESVSNKLVLEGVDRARVNVIYNGLDLDRVSSSPISCRREAVKSLGIACENNDRHFGQIVTIVANMRHEVKDYPMFLRAAKQVVQSVSGVEFLLAGEGELLPAIKQLSADLGIADRTHFLGRCQDVATLLAVSDVCVLSSKAEGFSNSILEYMAASKPVVATDVGGAREAIVEGETGYLVESGDDKRLAERIISLLIDSERAAAMGRKGRRVVEQKFSNQSMLQRVEALYEKLLAENLARKPDTLRLVENGLS